MKDKKVLGGIVIILVVVIGYFAFSSNTTKNDTKDYNAPNEEISELMQELDENPEDKTILLNLAHAYHTIDMFDKEIETYEKLIELFPTEPLFRFNLGTTYKSQKQYPEAVKSFEEGVRVNHKLSFMYLPLIDIYEIDEYRDLVDIDFIIGQFDILVAEAGSVGNQGLGIGETHLYLGRIYKIQKEYDLSIENYSKSLEYIPSESTMIQELIDEVKELKNK